MTATRTGSSSGTETRPDEKEIEGKKGMRNGGGDISKGASRDRHSGRNRGH
jgi:hypothetical protein